MFRGGIVLNHGVTQDADPILSRSTAESRILMLASDGVSRNVGKPHMG